MNTSLPAPERPRIDRSSGREGAPGISLEIAEIEEGHYAPVAKQPSWHLWGLMVGCMAAGAAILAILSLTSA